MLKNSGIQAGGIQNDQYISYKNNGCILNLPLLGNYVMLLKLHLTLTVTV